MGSIHYALTIVFPNFTALGRMAVAYVSKLDAIATKKVHDDFGETEHIRNKAITKIRQWYQSQPHLNHFELGALIFPSVQSSLIVSVFCCR